MASISLCMIVKNEQKHLARCLTSVANAVDEIIIVDTGSQDDTKKIAGQFTNKVFDFTWIDDFSAARNEAFSHATKDFILWLDADDVFEDQTALIAFKRNQLEQFDMVMAPYHVAFDEEGKPTFTYFRERLFRRSSGYRWEGAVHEAIVPSGRIVYADFAVRHEKIGEGDSSRNLRIYEKLLREGRKLSARERFYYGRELMTHRFYDDAEKQLQSVISDPSAWKENALEACENLAQCRLAREDTDGAIEALLKSFALDAPRAEIVCELGRLLLEKDDLAAARFWYETALDIVPDARSGAFVRTECYNYIPLLQLCLIYDRMGDKEKARSMHERAMALWPEDQSVKYNQAYFEKQVAQ